jgi:hypothetical protein
MYRGDGSYKASGVILENSLLDLLNLEHEYVSKLNECYKALDIAKKSSLRTNEYTELIKINKEKLDLTRNEIKEYCKKIGIAIIIGDNIDNNRSNNNNSI